MYVRDARYISVSPFQRSGFVPAARPGIWPGRPCRLHAATGTSTRHPASVYRYAAVGGGEAWPNTDI